MITIKPTKQVRWVTGLKTAFASLNAKPRGQYSWVAKSDDGYVYTAEIDHIDKDNNAYDHIKGVYTKYVSPLTKEQGHTAVSIRHAKELFEAVTDTFNTNLKCRLLLVKGTKFGTTNDGVKAAADNDFWQVTRLDGSVSEGFGFTLERVE